MHKLLSSNKAQFFVISTIIVTSTLVGLQFLFSGYGEADTSDPFLLTCDYDFWAAKNQVEKTYQDNSCPQMELKLEETENLVTESLERRSSIMEISHPSVCSGSTKQAVDVFMNLTQYKCSISTTFQLSP